MPKLSVLTSHPFPSPPAHWDNACSFTTTNNPHLLHSMLPLSPPISMTGIGGTCRATHAGFLNILPSINHMNLALYSPSFPQTLLSLGHIHRSGGSYHTTNLPQPSLVIRLNDSVTLDVSPLTTNSNLSPVNYTSLHQAKAANPSLYQPNPTHHPLNFPLALYPKASANTSTVSHLFTLSAHSQP